MSKDEMEFRRTMNRMMRMTKRELHEVSETGSPLERKVAILVLRGCTDPELAQTLLEVVIDEPITAADIPGASTGPEGGLWN